jgi:hypothetical protein
MKQVQLLVNDQESYIVDKNAYSGRAKDMEES